MPYMFLNVHGPDGPDDRVKRTVDDKAEDALNHNEQHGWRVVDVKHYDNGGMKFLLHRHEPLA
jgi:hypothetical protein